LKDKDSKFKDLGDMVKNGQAVQDWILPGAKYKAIFTKEVIGSTPPFNDSGLITCNKWHVRGFCYECAIVRVLINDSRLQLTRLLTILGSMPSRLRTPDN